MSWDAIVYIAGLPSIKSECWLRSARPHNYTLKEAFDLLKRVAY